MTIHPLLRRPNWRKDVAKKNFTLYIRWCSVIFGHLISRDFSWVKRQVWILARFCSTTSRTCVKSSETISVTSTVGGLNLNPIQKVVHNELKHGKFCNFGTTQHCLPQRLKSTFFGKKILYLAASFAGVAPYQKMYQNTFILAFYPVIHF